MASIFKYICNAWHIHGTYVMHGTFKLYQIIPMSATPAQNFEVLSGFIRYRGKTYKSNGFYWNAKTGLPLNLNFGFSILLIFSTLLILCVFRIVFRYFWVIVWPSTSGFTIISQTFSECWLVEPVQWPVGPFLSRFTTVTQNFSYATGYSYVK